MRTLGADEWTPHNKGDHAEAPGRGSQGIGLLPPLLVSQEGESLGLRLAGRQSAGRLESHMLPEVKVRNLS